MKDRNQMTRICSACGIEKPLAAFLEISSTHGTRYGMICATCRGAGITEKKPTNTEEDTSTIATTGSRIGLKERIFIETEQKKQLIASKDAHIEQINKREALKEEQQDKKDLKEKSEKDHRRTYLDPQKQPGFLGKKSPAGGVAKTHPATETPAVITQPAKQEQHKIALETKQRGFDAARENLKKTTFNLVDQYIDPQAGETRAHSAAFLAFKYSQVITPFNMIDAQLKKLTEQNKPPAAAKNKEPTAKKDPLLEFIEDKWSGPSSTRRR
jgi:hypothetical protein